MRCVQATWHYALFRGICASHLQQMYFCRGLPTLPARSMLVSGLKISIPCQLRESWYFIDNFLKKKKKEGNQQKAMMSWIMRMHRGAPVHRPLQTTIFEV